MSKSKSDYRFIARSNGMDLRLFSLRRTKTGDVILALGVGDKVRGYGMARGQPVDDGVHDRDLSEFRFTVHPSLDSATDNRINTHHVLKDGTHSKISTTTATLKSDGGFVFLFARRDGQLPDPSKPLPQTSGSVVSLGEYDPFTFTLFYSVYISRLGREVAEPPSDSNVVAVELGDFRVTVLWSYFPTMSTPDGTTILAQKVAAGGDTDLSKIVRTEPIAPYEVAAFHRQTAVKAFDELVSSLLSRMRFRSLADELLMRTYFYRDKVLLASASKHSLAYQAHKSKNGPIDLGRQMMIDLIDYGPHGD